MFRKFAFITVLALAVSVATAARAQHEPEPVVNPKTYRSPSGNFALTVEPSERFGVGPARYRLARVAGDVGSGKTPVWAGERPFTLYDAVVADDGAVAGYSYSLGRDSMNPKSRGDFHVVFLNPRGQVRRDERTPRRWSPVMHSPPEPTAEGLILDAPRDRLLVLLSPAHWLVYRFSDGRRLGQTNTAALLPEATMRSGALYAMESRLETGAGLILTRWQRYADDGARFALIDPAPPGRVVWSLDLPRERTSAPDESKDETEDAPDPVFDAILPTENTPGRFALWLAAKGERVDFAVEPVRERAGRWQVQETGRQPADAPASRRVTASPSTPLLPTGTLPALGAFTLREPDGGAAPAIRAVGGLGLDGHGRPGFLRQEAGRSAFALVEPEGGEVVREVDLSAQDRLDGGKLHLAWVGPGERWLVTASRRQGKALGWFLDADTGGLTAVEGFDCPHVESLAGAGDGRFVVLRSSPDQLLGFGPDGRRLWTVKGSYETLFSPHEVTVLDDEKGQGKVAAVVETVGQHVGFFDLSTGRLLRRVDLEKVWGRAPNYPAGICPDENGGFIVQDFNGSPPYVRMTAGAGAVRGALSPRREDGRPLSGTDLRRDPAGGRLWTSDGDALLRLSVDGATVDRALGGSARGERLGNIDVLTVDDAGRIYAVDRGTGAVHTFDAAGVPLRVLRAAPGQVPANFSTRNLAVAPDGRVFLEVGYGWDGPDNRRRVEFAADGRALGIRALTPKDTHQSWLFAPRGNQGEDTLLILGDERVCLTTLDAAMDKAPRTINRQPDGCWLEAVQTAAFAPDGGFAVISIQIPAWLMQQPWTVNLYDPTGEPRRTFRLAGTFNPYQFAFNGRHFATRQGARLAVFDAATGEPILAFQPELPGGLSLERGSWSLFSVREGSELWLVEAETRTVVRFAWPR